MYCIYRNNLELFYFQGFEERLNRDLHNIIPKTWTYKLIPTGTKERRFAMWVGGLIAASIGSFKQSLLSQHDYNEGGKTRIHPHFM